MIVANSYSKAVLRAVAGAICDANAHVDYFPSFESVTLTKQQSVWEPDLIHVAPAFVDRIMARVVQAYAPGLDARRIAREERVRRFDQCVAAGDLDEAEALYAEISDDPQTRGDATFEIAAATLLAALGRPQEARGHAERGLAGVNENMQRIDLVLVYARLGEPAAVERLLDVSVEVAGVSAPDRRRGRPAGRARPRGSGEPRGRTGATARPRQRLRASGHGASADGRRTPPEAVAALRAAVALDAVDARAQFLLGRALLESGEPQEATRHIRASLDLEPDARGRRFFLATALERSGRRDDAERELLDLAAGDPSDANAAKALAGLRARRPAG